MKLELPEFLLCEDPTSEKENLYIYHTPTRSFVHIVHIDSLSQKDLEIMRHANSNHIDYIYRNAVGNTETIMFVTEANGNDHNTERRVLQRCARWYGCYLGWETNCDDIIKSA